MTFPCRSRWPAAASLAALPALVALAGCGRGPAGTPAPVPEPATPVEPEPTRASLPTAWRVAPEHASTAYRVSVRTVLTAPAIATPAAPGSAAVPPADTAGWTDADTARTPRAGTVAVAVDTGRQETRATIRIARRRDSAATILSGSVQDLAVRATPDVAYAPPRVASLDSVRPLAPPPPRDSLVPVLTLPPVAFRARDDGSTHRVVAQPPLVNECTAPEVAALDLVRSLLLAWPDSLAVADSWTDSARTLVCRADVPTTVATTTTWRVVRALGDVVPPELADVLRPPGSERERRRVVLALERRVTVAGERIDPWRPRRITGTGSSRGVAVLDAEDGRLVALALENRLPLTFVDGLRDDATRTLTQQASVRVVLASAAMPPANGAAIDGGAPR